LVDFYLESYDLREPWGPCACEIIRRLRYEKHDDMALVRITPPLNRWVYNTDHDLYELMLLARHTGHSLFPVSKRPTHVYIFQPITPVSIESDSIARGSLAMLGWGLVIEKSC